MHQFRLSLLHQELLYEDIFFSETFMYSIFMLYTIVHYYSLDIFGKLMTPPSQQQLTAAYMWNTCALATAKLKQIRRQLLSLIHIHCH